MSQIVLPRPPGSRRRKFKVLNYPTLSEADKKCGLRSSPMFSRRMTARAAFRDVTMPVRVGTDRRFWLLSAKPVFDNAGVFTGYHGVGADVTEKRLAEKSALFILRATTRLRIPEPRVFSGRDRPRARPTHARTANRQRCFVSISTNSNRSTTRFGHAVGDALLKLVGKRIQVLHTQPGRRRPARRRRICDLANFSRSADRNDDDGRA